MGLVAPLILTFKLEDDFMWIFFIFILFSTFFITYKIMDYTLLRKIERDEFNTLYECLSCGKFHRKYQEELHLLIDSNYHEPLTCPRCYKQAVIYTGEYFEWMKTNPECPELNQHETKIIKKAMKNAESLKTENRSLEAFLHYYYLNGPLKSKSNRE